MRHRHLATTKFFSCSCPRCSDPAECGALSSAMRCPGPACPGPVLPPRPPHLTPGPAPDWACQLCGAGIPHRKVVTMQNCGAQLVHSRQPGPAPTRAVLDRLNTWFHPNHYTVMEVGITV